jgi:CBS domain-containing protein
MSREEVVIADIMTTNIVTIDESNNVLEAAKVMTEKSISSLIVERSDETPIGIITERDFVRKICSKDLLPSQVKIGDIMSKIQIFAEPTASVQVAVQRMLNHKVRRLPIIENGKVVGIVTVTDLAKELRKKILTDDILARLSDNL